MSIQVRRRPRCIRCGAALSIAEGAQTVECRYCGEIMEVTGFTQEERRLTAAIDEMNRSICEAQQRVEDTIDEFARTGSAAAGALQRQAEAQYQSLREQLEKLHAEYENGQAKKLSGWFVRGENAQHLRRYDEAIQYYSNVLAIESGEAEVHWRVLLCRYGVEYVLDQSTGSYLPTLTKMQVDDILQDPDYLDACRCARDDSARTFYEREGKRLDRILRKYQVISERPYDVFISVKQGDDQGSMTPDAKVGLSLYHTLNNRGLHVFNSAESLKSKAGEEYEPYIMHALTTAKLMVVIASNEEYISSRWLKNEWRRFRWLRESEGAHSERRLIVYSIKQGTPLKIPAEIGIIQNINAQSSAEPVAELCRIAQDMFTKDTAPNVIAAQTDAVQRASSAAGEDEYRKGICFLYGRDAQIDKKKAFECFERAARKGHAQSVYELGMRYLTGEGVSKDVTEAAKWFKKGAKLGCACAQYEYAYCCDKGIGTQADLDAAIVWYDRALKQFRQTAESDGMSMYYLGRSLLYGEGSPVEEKTAIDRLRNAAVEGVCEAQFLLGRCYEDGRGVARNDAQAVQNFQKAASQGHEGARARLELIDSAKRQARQAAEQERLNEERARREAEEKARQAAEQKRLSEERARREAEEKARQAAEQKRLSEEKARREAEERARQQAAQQTGMQALLAQIEEKIRQIEEEEKRQALLASLISLVDGLRRRRQAATTEMSAEAMYRLGEAFRKGKDGMPENPAMAAQWYRKAAEQGHAAAQYSLGWFYEFGRGGMTRNVSEAFRWYQKAAAQGHSAALIQVELVRKELMKEQNRTLSERNPSEMTPDQMNAAGTDYFRGRGVQKDFEQAVRWYRMAAERGNMLAQYNLGCCYEEGHGVNADGMQAVMWYQKAASQGYTLAMRRLGDLYYYGSGVPKDYRTALGWYEKAASNGNALAKEQIARCQTALKKEVPLPKKETVMTGAQMWERGNNYAGGHGVPKNYETAFGWYLKAAQTGHAAAQNNVGDCYYNGRGTAQNFAKAFEWFEKSAAQGYAYAQSNLGVCYYNGRGTVQNYAKAVELYKKAAQQGNAGAQQHLGECYSAGNGVCKSDETAFTWYMKAAQAGHAAAQNNTGDCYYRGCGVKQDYAKAFEWFKKSAAQGYVYAQSNLALCYTNGQGTAQNHAQAFDWYRKAALQGHAKAQYNLGIFCENGRGISKNLPEAVKWYEKAALQGHAEAQYSLGRCYADGLGTARNAAKAFEWYQKAALQNYVEAQYSLGKCHTDGLGTAKSDAKAFEWYQKAAILGHPAAQYRLGDCHEKGIGTAKNRAKAIEWHEKAAAQGNEDAKKAVKRLKSGFFSKLFS